MKLDCCRWLLLLLAVVEFGIRSGWQRLVTATKVRGEAQGEEEEEEDDDGTEDSDGTGDDIEAEAEDGGPLQELIVDERAAPQRHCWSLGDLWIQRE